MDPQGFQQWIQPLSIMLLYTNSKCPLTSRYYLSYRENDMAMLKLYISSQQAAVAAALGPYGQAALGRGGGGGYPGGAAAEMAVSDFTPSYFSKSDSFWPQALQQYKDMMTRAAMSPGGSSAAAAAAAMSAALGPNASAAMSALGPSASVAASMASMASGHQVGFQHSMN